MTGGLLVGFKMDCKTPLRPHLQRWLKVLNDPKLANQLGTAGRKHVIAHSSLDSMTDGYTELIESVFREKVPAELPSPSEASPVFPRVDTGPTDSQTPVV